MTTMNDSYEMLKLDNQLCFPLYAVSREIVKKYKPYLDEINLTHAVHHDDGFMGAKRDHGQGSRNKAVS